MTKEMEEQARTMADLAERAGLTSIASARSAFAQLCRNRLSEEQSWWVVARCTLIASEPIFQKIPFEDAREIAICQSVCASERRAWSHAGSVLLHDVLEQPRNAITIAHDISRHFIELVEPRMPRCAKNMEHWRALEALVWRTYDAIHSACILLNHGLVADALVAIRCATEASVKFKYLLKHPEGVEKLQSISQFSELIVHHESIEASKALNESPHPEVVQKYEKLQSSLRSNGYELRMDKKKRPEVEPRLSDSWKNHFIDKSAAKAFGDKNAHVVVKSLFDMGNAFAHSQYSVWDGWVQIKGQKLVVTGRAVGTEAKIELDTKIWILCQMFVRHLHILRSGMKWNYEELFAAGSIATHAKTSV